MTDGIDGILYYQIGVDILDDKNKKTKIALYVDIFILGSAFIISAILIAITSEVMTPVNFWASTCILAFVFTGISRGEYLYKMPICIFAAVTIGALVSNKLTLLGFFAIIFGAISSMILVFAAMKVNAHKYKHMQYLETESQEKKRT